MRVLDSKKGATPNLTADSSTEAAQAEQAGSAEPAEKLLDGAGLAAEQDEDCDCAHRTIVEGDGFWHGGPGWYYVDDEYPEEGSCGAFDTREEAEAHARAACPVHGSAPRSPAQGGSTSAPAATKPADRCRGISCDRRWGTDEPCPVHDAPTHSPGAWALAEVAARMGVL